MADYRTQGEVRARVDEVLKKRDRPPAGGLLTAAIRVDHLSRFLAGTLVMKDQPVDPRQSREYRTIALIEQWLPLDELDAWLSRALGGHFVVGGRTIPTQFANAIEGPLGPGPWSFSEISDVVIACTLETNILGHDYSPVVRAGLAPYMNFKNAARDWIYGSVGTGIDSIPNEGRLLVVVSDTRGRIVEAEWNRNDLNVVIDARFNSTHLDLQTRFEGSMERPEPVHVSPSESCKLDVPADTERISLYLVADDDLLSRVQLTRSQPAFGQRKKEADAVAQIERDLSAGENERVEFKPFIRERGTKADEVVEAVVAFANSGGGTVYVGVSNRGTLDGYSALHDCHRKSKTPIDDQVSFLRALFSDNIKPGAAVDVNEHVLRGEPLIVITVHPSNRRCATQNNEVFVRKGATCRLADPHTELPNLGGRTL